MSVSDNHDDGAAASGGAGAPNRASDPRERDPREAERIDPKSGTSDDPRVEPKAVRGNTDDAAWQNELTEEDLPAPERREDAARTTALDPA